MQMTYSREADALAIRLAPDRRPVRSTHLGPGINVDFDADGRLIGVEVLRASEAYDRTALEQLGTPTEFLTLAEAAKESGLAPSTLRVQLNAGKLAGVKRGRDWLIPGHELWNYLERRAPAGRLPASRKARARRRRQRDAPTTAEG